MTEAVFPRVSHRDAGLKLIKELAMAWILIEVSQGNIRSVSAMGMQQTHRRTHTVFPSPHGLRDWASVPDQNEGDDNRTRSPATNHICTDLAAAGTGRPHEVYDATSERFSSTKPGQS